jgi:uridine phosphorylase
LSKISETDLILNPDGSVYHLNLLPDDIADTIITVGDPDRVTEVSKYFDHVELKKGKREFITHTGYIGQKRITVISTGIGTDNIDIILNELDALVNIDFETRQPYAQLKSLNIIRIGTSGAIQADVPLNSLLVSSAAIGLDVLMNYYEHHLNDSDQQFLNAFADVLHAGLKCNPYFAIASEELLIQLAADIPQGITITAPGFYAPQGRAMRIKVKAPDLLSAVTDFSHDGKKITNLEMETAGIYGLAGALGHKAISFNVILANRVTQQFSKNPAKMMEGYIQQLLQAISA